MITRAESPVYLRAIDEGDLEPVHRWHNDPALYASLVGTFAPTSLATERAWLQRVSAWSEQARNFALCAREDERLIGLCYLREIDWTHRHTELHILIGDDRDRGRGFGRAAVELLLDQAFDTLGLARVYLHVLASNAAARRLYAGRPGAVDDRLIAEGRLRRLERPDQLELTKRSEGAVAERVRRDPAVLADLLSAPLGRTR